MILKMQVEGLLQDSGKRPFIMLLKEDMGNYIIPIRLEQTEAESVAIALEGIWREIPDPYDSISSLIASLKGSVSKVVIRDMPKNRYPADVYLSCEAEEIRIQTYAGEAVASALRSDAPIFFKSESVEARERARIRGWLNDLKPKDFG